MLFRSHATRIPSKLLWINVLWCTFGTLILIIACQALIPLFFTAKYTEALHVLPVLAAGMALSSLSQPFHAFFAAQRKGRPLKIMSVTTSLLNVILNVILIPIFSIYGAGIALISSFGVNVVMNIYYYRIFLREQRLPTGIEESVIN